MTILVPMPGTHFDTFVEATTPSHAADNVASGRWLESEAEGLARSELHRLLPQGSATPDHHFYEIKLEAAAPALGFVWLGATSRGSVKLAFVFQLFVYPQFRRQGHGKAALLQVEALAQSLGLAGVALNVFASNSQAQSLYRSLGYFVTSVGMQKQLPPSLVA